MPPEFGANLLELGLPPFAHRPSTDRKLARSGLCTNMGEAEEIEGLWFPLPMARSVLRCKTAKFDEACFTGMQLEAKPCKAFAQLSKQPLGDSGSDQANYLKSRYKYFKTGLI